jgi:succinyl-diaminopimelate desuccinylase
MTESEGEKKNGPVVALCMELVSRPSITPKDEGCQQLLATKLRDSGFHIENFTHIDTSNIYATHGEGYPNFCFAGHTDVVPPGELSAWAYSPFEPVIHDGMIYGRGTADMKGGDAAMVIAAKRFVEKHPDHKGTISFIFTSNEEGDFVNGTPHVVSRLMERNEHINYCVVGEPSSDKVAGDTIKIGRRGSITADIKVFGIQGHVAYPHLGRNPIHEAAPAIAELVSYVWDNGNDYFPPTSMQIPNIKAGTGANNVIPGELYIQVNWRFNTETTAEKIKQVTNEIFSKYRLNYKITWSFSGDPFITESRELIEAVRASVMEVCGVEVKESTAGGTSDGRFIAKFPSCQVIELGPLSETIHKANECTSAEELDKLALVYEKILERILL